MTEKKPTLIKADNPGKALRLIANEAIASGYPPVALLADFYMGLAFVAALAACQEKHRTGNTQQMDLIVGDIAKDMAERIKMKIDEIEQGIAEGGAEAKDSIGPVMGHA